MRGSWSWLPLTGRSRCPCVGLLHSTKDGGSGRRLGTLRPGQEERTMASWWKYVRENRAYHGAGLLFAWTELQTGGSQALLGLRKQPPGKDQWSIPGGERKWEGA